MTTTPTRTRGTPRGRGERGASESVQWAVLTPVVMLMFLGIIQAGIWYHGSNVAGHAAAAAARAESVHGAASGSGRAAAEAIVGNGGLDQVAVEVSRGAGTIDVVVTGRAPMVFDLGLGAVRRTASAPLEQQR